MTTRVDLATQVQGVLPRLYGGNGNTAGYAHSQLIIPFLNDSGATLGIGDVVTRRAASPVLATSIVGDEKVLGVIVGRYNDTTGNFEAANPTAGQTAAICVVGVCTVRTSSAATRGQYLVPGATGQAAPSSTKADGSFGYVIYTMASDKVQALIGQMEGDRVTTGQGVPWFNVKDYGAVGNGSTDDTTAINLAIAALNTATGGVLYFPAGTYKVTAALTTITAVCIVQGDGHGTASTVVTTASATIVLFTISADYSTFRDLWLSNTAVTATAGAAIVTTGGTFANFDKVYISGFYTGIDIEDSLVWGMQGCILTDARKYGIRIRNTAVPDGGDWMITNSAISTTHPADAAIQVESSGGGKISNLKINGLTGSNRFTTGINVSLATGIQTSVLLISNTSIENVTTDAIYIKTAGTGIYQSIAIHGVQCGLISNNSGRAVKLEAAATGVGAGSIAAVVIDGCVFTTTGTARAAVEIIKADNVTLGDIVLVGFNARYTSSGSPTNIVDSTAIGSGSFATPAIVLGTAAAAGAASTVIASDSTIVAFDATVPVTQAFSDAAATGSQAVAARRDHKHGMPANPATFGEILIVDTPSTPLVFADLVQNDDQTDLLYADP